MDVQQALRNIKNVTHKLAAEEIACIREHRDEAVPVLLEYVRAATDPEREAPDGYDAHTYAMYLLAEFRVYDAFPYLIKYLEIEQALTDRLLDDILTEDFSSILASVTTVDDLPRIKSVIENTELGTNNREAALDVLKVLYTEDMFGRDEYVSYTHHLLDTHHSDPDMLASVIWNCVDSGFREFQPKIKKLYRAKLVNEHMIGFNEVKADLIGADEAAAKRDLKRNGHNLFIRDTIESVCWWSIFCDSPDTDKLGLPGGLTNSNERDSPKSRLDGFIQFIRESVLPVAQNQRMSAIEMIESFKSETKSHLTQEDIDFCGQIISKGMSVRQAVAAVLDYADNGFKSGGLDMPTAHFKGAYMINYVTVSIGLLLSYSPPRVAPVEIPEAYYVPPPLDPGPAIIAIPHHSIIIRIHKVADEAWYGSRREKTGALVEVTVFKLRQNWQMLYDGHFIDAHYPRFSLSCAVISDCPAYQDSALKFYPERGYTNELSTGCKMGPNRSRICPYETEASKAYGTGLLGLLAIATMCFDRWRKRPLRSGTKKTKSYSGNGVAFIAITPQWEHVSEGFREVQLREFPDFARQMQSRGWSVENRSSPCEHERRGHIRTLKDGRKVFVRPSIVNKGGEKVVYRIDE
jgi:hypothetical protein